MFNLIEVFNYYFNLKQVITWEKITNLLRIAPIQAEVITEQMEQELWEKIVLDGKTIQNSLFLSWEALCSPKLSKTP